MNELQPIAAKPSPALLAAMHTIRETVERLDAWIAFKEIERTLPVTNRSSMIH